MQPVGCNARGSFDCHIVERSIKIRKLRLGKIQNVRGEAARACGGFDEMKLRGTSHLSPHFSELTREQAAENRMNIDAGIVIGEAAHFRLVVIAMQRMIETLAHIFREGDGAVAANAFGKQRSKRHAPVAPAARSFCNLSQVRWKVSRERSSNNTK